MGATGTLWADFVQTFLKAVLAGYALGCGSGFLVALLVDRVPFLQRGLLPLGNFVSALPIVGIAPIMVMWFGRSEEHTSELQSLMRISYAVFCLKKKKKQNETTAEYYNSAKNDRYVTDNQDQ